MQYHSISGVLIALAASGWLLAQPAAADLYKWTDADGKVHYSDQPPPPSVKKPVTVKPRKPSATAPAAEGEKAAAPKSYVEQDAEFKRRQVEAAEREAKEKKAAQESEDKKRNCEQARGQLASLEAGGRLTRYNAQGEKEFMDDAQIAQERTRAQQLVASWCN